MRSTKRALLGVVLGLALAPWSARAQVGAFCDTGAGLATLDGTIEAGEYAGFTGGVGDGFGGIIGADVEIHLDSDAAGNLALAIDGTGRNCSWTSNDTVVLYIDSVPDAGFADTTGFTDTADAGRAGISAANPGGGRADLTFAPGFRPDYAIAIRNDSANLFELVAGGSHAFVATLTRAPLATFSTSCVKELAGFSMAQLGSQAGNPLRWVATALNPNDNPPFRSNELHGLAVAPVGNIGGASFTMPPGSRNLFATNGIAAFRGERRVWIDFGTFAGAGFTPTPTCGQLSSLSWAVTGLSDGNLEFGGTGTTGDFARGFQAPSFSTGGVVAYDVAPNDRALGVVPGGSDFTPGSFTLRARNEGTLSIASLAVSYVIQVFNSQPRANSFNFSFSTDGTTFTPLPVLDYTSPEAADASPAWVTNPRSAVLTGLDLAPGAFIYLRWTGDDVSGTGSRDRFALDDIVLVPTAATCGNGTLDPGEACDAGAANGTVPCGCTARCAFVAAGTVCRASSAPCDAEETCDGTGAPCPADALAPADTVCAPADPSLPCDAPDVCDGISAACAPRVASAGTVCRAAVGVCDEAERCDGSALTCPPDGTAADGTACADEVACNGAEVCRAGACVGMPVDCDDDDVCTADLCEEPAGSCANTPIAGCCRVDAECDDEDPCTQDVCTASNTCESVDLCAVDGGAVDPDGGPVVLDGGAILPDAGPRRDAGAADANVFADGGDAPMARGCSCRVPAGSSPSAPALGLVGLLVLVLARRRRR